MSVINERDKRQAAFDAADLIVTRMIQYNNYCDIPTTWRSRDKMDILYPLIYDAINKALEIKTIKIVKDENGNYRRV